jgi:hypothetical protein
LFNLVYKDMVSNIGLSSPDWCIFLFHNFETVRVRPNHIKRGEGLYSVWRTAASEETWVYTRYGGRHWGVNLFIVQFLTLEQCILNVFTMYLCYATHITWVMPNSGLCERQMFELCNFLSLSMRVTQSEFACHLWHACHRFAITALRCLRVPHVEDHCFQIQGPAEKPDVLKLAPVELSTCPYPEPD